LGCDTLNPARLVEFAAENKLEQVRAILAKHPDKVCCMIAQRADCTVVSIINSIQFSQFYFRQRGPLNNYT